MVQALFSFLASLICSHYIVAHDKHVGVSLCHAPTAGTLRFSKVILFCCWGKAVAQLSGESFLLCEKDKCIWL